MNNYLKSFLHRGVIFAGFGPIVLGIVFWCIELCGVELKLGGSELLLAIFSTYVLAFVQAGASVFNQIEEWPITKSLFCHFSLLFVIYSITYIMNRWIPFEPLMLLFFCLVFTLSYFAIWFTVYLLTRSHTKKLNSKL